MNNATKIGILIATITIGAALVGRDRYSESGSVSDTAYDASWDNDITVAPSKNAVYDKIEAISLGLDPNSHEAVTVTDSNSIDLTLTEQNITADVNEVWLAANAGTGSVATHESTYDHNDIATALQSIPDGNYGAITVSGTGTIMSFSDPNTIIGYLIQEWLTAGTYLDVNDSDNTIDVNNTYASQWNSAYSWVNTNGTNAVTGYTRAGNLTTLSGVAENATTLGAFDGEIIADNRTVKEAIQDLEDNIGGTSSNYKYYPINIYYPNYLYNSVTYMPIDPNTNTNITILEAYISGDIDPNTEISGDLVYVDDIQSKGNEALITDVNTTNGVKSVVSGWTSNAVPADRAIMLKLEAQPDAYLGYISGWIKFVSTDTYNYYSVAVVEPNEAYDRTHYIICDANVDAARTISEVYVSCDSNPTSEPNMTLCFADNGVGYENETVICKVDTTDGVALIQSDWTDNTVPASKKVYFKWNAAPDANLTLLSGKVKYAND